MEYIGQTIKVQSFIPYKTKVEAAQELVAIGAIFDEKLGIAYWSHMYEAATRYVRLKYYTDFDLTAYEGAEGLYLLMDRTDTEDSTELDNAVGEDFDTVRNLAWDIYHNVKYVFEHEHSLGQKVLGSFGFLFDGKDITESLAEAREISEKMIDTLGAAKKGGNVVDMSQYAKKPDKK